MSTSQRVKKAIAPPPDKDLKFKCTVRVYGAHGDPAFGHSYLVANVAIGISPPIATYTLDVTTFTFKQLREVLQYNTTTAGHMKKRSLEFQEATFLMSSMPNVYNRPKDELTEFQFGFSNKSSLHDVKLVDPAREIEPIANLIGRADFFEHDIMVVPLSQIPPTLLGQDVDADATKDFVRVDDDESAGDKDKISF